MSIQSFGAPNAPEPRFNPRGMGERKTDTPRKVRNGLKLQAKLPFAPRSSLGQRWLNLFESHIPTQPMLEGAEYARLGQTVSLDFAAGLMEAKVQGTAARPYGVRASFDPRRK